MILEVALALGAASALGASALGWLAWRRARAGAEATTSTETPGRRRIVEVGDVVLSDGNEHWAAGEIVLDEEGVVLVLHPSPGSVHGWIATLGPTPAEVYLLDETSEIPLGAVPSELRIAGDRLRLRARGKASVTARGELVPDGVRPTASYTVLEAPLGRLAVVVDFDGGTRLALAGRRSAIPTDILPGRTSPRPRDPER